MTHKHKYYCVSAKFLDLHNTWHDGYLTARKADWYTDNIFWATHYTTRLEADRLIDLLSKNKATLKDFKVHVIRIRQSLPKVRTYGKKH